ncbi:uncharacterized protein [Zea mays]|uniref:uncharacterized protein n=1 Tax=Zea mays TaxID=4577 RepID=UPI0009AA3F75|nr:uncharacterized protein LOC109945514 [Zea mays]|eukprot:XP_020407422.1 uncharacterized protein LOC109945514 [Zea mays]
MAPTFPAASSFLQAPMPPSSPSRCGRAPSSAASSPTQCPCCRRAAGSLLHAPPQPWRPASSHGAGDAPASSLPFPMARARVSSWRCLPVHGDAAAPSHGAPCSSFLAPRNCSSISLPQTALAMADSSLRPTLPWKSSKSPISSMAGAPRSASARLSLPKQRAPFLAARRGARRLFGKMRSKPRAAAALPFDLHSPRRVSSLSCSLRSPIRDAVSPR